VGNSNIKNRKYSLTPFEKKENFLFLGNPPPFEKGES
jgi:hypothetical protein